MASGRMLQRKISKSHDVIALMERTGAELGFEHGPFAALLFTWCIAHQDVEGRMHGDPRLVKADVFPLIDQITAAHVAVYLQHMADLGMVKWYEANGRKWLAFPAFKDSQPGLRKDREPPSTIPEPKDGVAVIDGRMPATIRQTAVKLPAQVEEKRSRREVEGKERPATPKAPREPTDAFRVVEVWKHGWVERFKPEGGRAPEPHDPDWKQVKNLLGRHGLEGTIALVVRFLDDTDKLVAERGHMLRDLPGRVARYAKGDGPLFGPSPAVGHA